MKLASGQIYTLINLNTAETASFHVGFLGEYKGQYILYGEVLAHGVRVARGAILVPPREGCLVVLRDERGETIRMLTRRLHGLPLALKDNTKLVYILNSPGKHHGKDAMMKHASKLIDTYILWKEKGVWEWDDSKNGKGK